MKNIKIRMTDNDTILVVADTKRFGTNEIMFEGNTFDECFDYIERETGKEVWGYTGFSLMSAFYEDRTGKLMPRSMTILLQA